MPDLGRSRRAVETTDGGPEKEDEKDRERESTLEGGVPVVRGLDEAEMVLRVDTLANEDALNAARSAVTRMTELLEYVDATSRSLGCEPRNVFGHLLFRCGAPTDPTSRQLRLNDAVDPIGCVAWSRSPPSSAGSSGSRFRTTTTFSSRRRRCERRRGFSLASTRRRRRARRSRGGSSPRSDRVARARGGR